MCAGENTIAISGPDIYRLVGCREISNAMKMLSRTVLLLAPHVARSNRINRTVVLRVSIRK